MAGPDSSAVPARRDLGLPLLTAACGLLAAGWFASSWVPWSERQALDRWEHELEVRSELLRTSLDTWLSQGVDQARLIARYPSVLAAFHEGGDGHDHSPEHLSEVLEVHAATFGLEGVSVVASGARPLMVVGRRPPVSRQALALGEAAMRARSPRVDLLPVEDGGPPRVCFAVPAGGPRAADGAILTASDPAQWLNPLLAAQRIASDSSEALLVRSEGDEVVFLTPLRAASAQVQLARHPADPGLAASAATAGVRGFGRYFDYRGVPILASTRRLEGAPWGLVVKVDLAEALAAQRRQVREVGALGGAALLGVGGLVLALWWGQRQQARGLLAGERSRLAAVLERAWDPILFLGADGEVRGGNQRAQEVYGEGLVGRKVGELGVEPGPWPPAAGVSDAVHRDRHGVEFPVQVSSSAVEQDGEQLHVQVVRDMRDQLDARARLEQLNRLYRVLSEVNEGLVRAAGAQEVLDLACTALVEGQTAQLAWIGLRESDGRVRPVAVAGPAAGYLTRIEVRWDQTPLGRGPAGSAIRQGRAVVVDELEQDERMRPWHAAAAEHRLRSCAAAPIIQGERVVGALLVYAAAPRAFDAEALALVGRLAADVGSALHLQEERERRVGADQALRERERFARAVADAVPGGIYVLELTPEGARSQFINRRLGELLGHTPEELGARGTGLLFSLLHPDDVARLPGLIARWETARDDEVLEEEVRLRHASGEWRAFALREVAFARDGRGQVTQVLGAATDVTERQRTEAELHSVQQQFLHAQRLESLGRLAGGVAHDFNNLLTVIQGYGKLALERLPDGHESRRAMEQVGEAATRAAQLTHQLLAFGRKLPPTTHSADLCAEVRGLEAMLRPLLSEERRLVLRVPADPLTVRIAPGQIEQVLLNLVANARDATPRDGVVTVEVEQVRGGPPVGRLPDVHVVLRVSDTGVGMDAPTQARLFEPFFTTKEPGKGTGLGLATLWGIVTQAGGTVTVESAPGEGSRFEVHLPLAKDSRSMPRPVTPAGAPRGQELVLMVEDEPGVRELLQEALELWGYRVRAAADPLEALDIWAAEGPAVDLVLSDVTMPHMSGPELVLRLRAERPDLRVLLMTGYAADQELTDPVVHKPVMPEALARAVRAVLDDQPLPG